jgi:hypothetical protein
MTYETRPRNLLRSISPQEVRTYALAKGWRRVPGVNGEITVFDHPSIQWEQLIVPMDETFDDYDKRVFEVIQTLAGIEARPATEILDDLLMPDSDVLRFSVTSPATARGLVPFVEGIGLLSGARKGLLASACSVLNPVPFHSHLRGPEALQFVGACQLGQTERNSYTIAISCPLRAVEPDQLFVFDAEPFTRSVTSLLIRSIDRIVRAIENDRPAEALEPSESEPVLSANLCDALLQMQPSEEPSTLGVSVSWAPTLPPRIKMPATVRIKSEHFRFIEDLYKQLRPTEAVTASLFIGKVVTLKGRPGPEGKMQGETTLALLHDEEIVKARADLGPADYQNAVEAHRNGEGIRFWGKLHLGRRIHRVTEISGFSVLRP